MLESAKALSPVERAEIAEELVLSMAAADADDAVRYAALKAAIDAAVQAVDAGEGVRVPADCTRDDIRELGREATRIVDSKNT